MVILLIDLIITVGCTFRIPDYSPVCLHPHLLFVSGSESHFYFSEPLWYWVRSPPYSRTMCLLSISKMTLFPNHILRYLGLRLQNTALKDYGGLRNGPSETKKPASSSCGDTIQLGDLSDEVNLALRYRNRTWRDGAKALIW